MARKSSSSAQMVPHSDVVRISIPAAVAADLDSFQKSIAGLVERLGCRACFSGADCLFTLERDFVIDPALKVNNIAPRVFAETEQKAMSLSASRPVTVQMPAQVSSDIDSVMKVVASVAGRLGCEACCSGFDILFRRELDFVVNPALELRSL